MSKEAAAVCKELVSIGLAIVAAVWIVGVPLGQTLKVVGTALVVGIVLEIVVRLGKAADFADLRGESSMQTLRNALHRQVDKGYLVDAGTGQYRAAPKEAQQQELVP